MKTKRGLYQQGALLLSALTLGAALTGCKFGSKSDEQQPQVVPTDQGQGNSIGAVARYAGMEAADTGQSSVRQAITARQAADNTSNIVATLQPNTVVTRIARYGNFSLVSWVGLGSAQQGWVDTNLAFGAPAVATTPRPPPTNAGTAFGSIGGTPTTPAPTTTAPPPATTPAPTATTPPPATATATASQRPKVILKPRH